jgi:HEAT repeat protein
MRVYAKFANGKLQKLRTLAAACPVEAKTPIQRLEGVSTDDSARWHLGLRRTDLDHDDWLHSLAVHRGDVAFTGLKNLARTDASSEVRKQSLFWMAIMRGTPETEAVIFDALNQDKDDDVREEAIFALSQLEDERATAALIKVAENRSLAREQRKRALFWLGQSDTASAAAYLDKVLMGSAAR